jgi:hypothetical protein
MSSMKETEEPLVPTQALIEQARIFAMEGSKLWEETLRLTIQEKPRWCPVWLYAAAVRLIIRQEKDRKVFHENWTRRRRFKLFRPPSVAQAPGIKVVFPQK